jgi:hypothetical protein
MVVDVSNYFLPSQDKNMAIQIELRAFKTSRIWEVFLL